MSEEEVTRIIDNIQLRLVAEKVGGIELRTKDEILLIKCIQELQQENKQLKVRMKKIKELIENDYFEDGSFHNWYEVMELLGDKENE